MLDRNLILVDFPHHPHDSFPNAPRVSFADHNEIVFIENLSHKYKAELWFTDSEMKSFKTQTVLLLINIKTNMTMAQYAEMNVQDTSAFMGLEKFMSKKTPKEIVYKREALYRTVHSEQQRQFESGIDDPDVMAKISLGWSDWSRKRANIIGLIHAEKR